MANRHFGTIGDIWKHLPLAEILRVEKPFSYWESHAGSALYTLTHSIQRDYGVFYFIDNTTQSPMLEASAYKHILNTYQQEGQLSTYPGSPLIALKVLHKNKSKFLFCDIDNESLKNIQETSDAEGISKVVEVIHADGISTLAEKAAKLSAENALTTFVHIDPFRPFTRSANGLHSIDLFSKLSQQGLKVLYWSGYDSYQYRDTLINEIKLSLAKYKVSLIERRIWCGDVSLAAIDDPLFDEHPGVLGCGIVASNLSEVSVKNCQRLGKELVGIYENALFPSGSSGALRYQAIWD
ncbi:23S rRNA (adenine(2030)-N(6))-methyltransferase RlmJ [Nostoc sp.]|uniref:23S rRNA (adenine(2030)-N(6))-methyltransferase RlmJ n=1 Tax=Nostoc sp. TaxID=1180 RepID=UPI002FF79A89